MIPNVLKDISGVDLYGVVSISLFFLVFLGAILFTVTQKKAFLQKMESLPLSGDEFPAIETPTGKNNHE
jgi:hypothetical protein